jgi:hypothetical protein
MPKGWFGPKLIGYGVGPRSWQGWAATALLMVMVVATRFIRPEQIGWPHWARPALLGAVLLAYFGLVYATYDPEA